jgi:hypothetical protein
MATSLPKRPLVLAALNGPPSNMALTAPSGSMARSTKRFPTDDDHCVSPDDRV